jgi:hypothetical protein
MAEKKIDDEGEMMGGEEVAEVKPTDEMEYLNQDLDSRILMLTWTRKLKTEHGLYSVKMAHAPDAYYSWTFEQRAQLLKAAGTESLCKTIVMRNTWYNEENKADPAYPKFICVITQYIRKLSAHKIAGLMKVYQNSHTKLAKCSSSMFKYRLATEEEAVGLTGYGHNGMTPFFMTNSDLLIILA